MDTKEFNVLIKKAKEKDKSAVDVLTKYCYNAIKFHIYARFGSNSDIDDWTQEIYMDKIFCNLPHQYIRHPIAWLNKISDNYVITELRRKKLTVELNNNILADEKISNVLDKVVIEQIKKYIDESTFNMIVLHNYYGFTFEHIAELMNLKADTVRQRVFRAKKTLQDVVTFDE